MTSYWIYAQMREKETKVPADILLAGAPLLYLLTRWPPLAIWGVAMALILANGDSPLVSKMNSLLNRPSLLFLGKISYSTYLIHYPILWLAKALVACVAPHASPFVVALALFALTTPATLCASALLHATVIANVPAAINVRVGIQNLFVPAFARVRERILFSERSAI
jgi:peptidoglycan/LPS O-acetylase OafA/YrhL